MSNVEPVDKVPRYSSQRQLRLGFELLVCWLVGLSPLFLENRSKDFLDFWHEVTSS